jgi:hypothetical protein
MGRTYTSVRGKEIDMEKLSLRHEKTPAVGNMRVNARGDELGEGGKIVRTREQVLQDYYAKHPGAMAEEVATRANKK